MQKLGKCLLSISLEGNCLTDSIYNLVSRRLCILINKMKILDFSFSGLSQVIVEELLQLSKLETIQWAQAGLATTLQSAFEMAELVVIRVTVTDIIFEELPGMRKLLRRSTELQVQIIFIEGFKAGLSTEKF